LDPHGQLVEEILAAVPEARSRDVRYLNIPDPTQSIRFNPLEVTSPLRRPLVASGIMDVFKKIWPEAWGVRLEHLLRNCLLTLLDQPAATLADVLRLIDDADFRRSAIDHVSNGQVRRFWLQEFSQYPVRYRAEAAAPIQNKLGAFLANPLLRRVLCDSAEGVNLRQMMDSGSVLLVNLAKGKIGEDASSLMGSLLVSQIGAAGLSRADVPEGTRRDFYLYLDEFQTFTTRSLAGMLSELRKYRVNLVLANQYLSQVDPQILDAILGNVGTTITFRVGSDDASFLAKDFGPITASDIMNLGNYEMFVKLMIGGRTSEPFSATTIADMGNEKGQDHSCPKWVTR